MRFDRALYMAAYFSQNVVPQRSRSACPHPSLLRWPEAWIWWENNSRLVRSIKDGTRDHQNCYFDWTKVLIGYGAISLLGFQSVYDQRLTEMCITDRTIWHRHRKIWVKNRWHSNKVSASIHWERCVWWKAILMKDHPEKRKTTLMRAHPDERPPRWKDHHDERPP